MSLMLEIILGVLISVLFLLCLMNAYFIDKIRKELIDIKIKIKKLQDDYADDRFFYNAKFIELRNLIDASDYNFTHLVNKLKNLEISNILSDIEELKKNING